MQAIELMRTALAAALLATAVLASGCGGAGENEDDGGAAVAVGSKNFTEQYILGELYAQALESRGFEVEKKLNLGSEQIADSALQSGEIDLYPEYTGTALAAIFHERGEAPKTAKATYERARELYASRNPADTMLTPARFDNSHGIVVNRRIAEEMNLRTLEDLAEASPELRFSTYSEFQNRADAYPNLKENYPAFDFEDTVIVNDLNLRYRGLVEGEADVGVGFLTDGQIADGNLAVMEDPKRIWPFYNPAPVVRSDTLRKHPQIKRILDEVSASLNQETMRRLNAAVDLDGQVPAAVARRYLNENGLLDEG